MGHDPVGNTWRRGNTVRARLYVFGARGSVVTERNVLPVRRRSLRLQAELTDVIIVRRGGRHGRRAVGPASSPIPPGGLTAAGTPNPGDSPPMVVSPPVSAGVSVGVLSPAASAPTAYSWVTTADADGAVDHRRGLCAVSGFKGLDKRAGLRSYCRTEHFAPHVRRRGPKLQDFGPLHDTGLHVLLSGSISLHILTIEWTLTEGCCR